MDGIIPLCKPKGMTSHDCVFKLRKLFGQKKVGHTGTLDPDVEGVLPICFGEATKIIPFLSSHHKEYVAQIKLGRTTDTEDASGETTSKMAVEIMPKSDEIKAVLSTFTGEITQVAPMYSAVKVNGKKLYEYARQGIEIERPVRKITIEKIELIRINDADQSVEMRVVCSKGTYIRTLCVDIGRKLGYPAHMGALTRTESDRIVLDETVDFQTLEKSLEHGYMEDYVLPLERLLPHLDALEMNEMTAKKVGYGQKLPLPEKKMQTEFFKMMHRGRLLAIYEQKETLMKPVRVFNLS